MFDFKKRIQKQALSILMRDYENKIINVTKFIIIDLYFSDIFEFDDNSIFIKIFIKVHFMENLKINILFETNIFISQKFLLKSVFQFIIIFNS